MSHKIDHYETMGVIAGQLAKTEENPKTKELLILIQLVADRICEK